VSPGNDLRHKWNEHTQDDATVLFRETVLRDQVLVSCDWPRRTILRVQPVLTSVQEIINQGFCLILQLTVSKCNVIENEMDEKQWPLHFITLCKLLLLSFVGTLGTSRSCFLQLRLRLGELVPTSFN
jgi:hypothetical protein